MLSAASADSQPFALQRQSFHVSGFFPSSLLTPTYCTVAAGEGATYLPILRAERITTDPLVGSPHSSFRTNFHPGQVYVP